MTALPLWVTIPGSLVLIISGLATLIGSLGLFRLDNFFSRMHGPSMTTTFGVGGVLIASMLVSSALVGRPILHELLITLFVTASAPITSIMLVQAGLYRDRARRGREATPNVDSATPN